MKPIGEIKNRSEYPSWREVVLDETAVQEAAAGTKVYALTDEQVTYLKSQYVPDERRILAYMYTPRLGQVPILELPGSNAESLKERGFSLIPLVSVDAIDPRLQFLLDHNPHWYAKRAANGVDGIMCYRGLEIEAPTFLQAIEKALIL